MISKKIPIVLTILVGLILGSSIIFNVLLFNRGKQYYLELNQTRLDPLGLNQYPVHSNPQNNLDRKTSLVFFGDSRAASWSSPQLAQYEFINRGIGSQTSVQTLQRFDHHVKPLKPDIILLQVGINDLKTIPLFPGKKESIIANCQGNIEQIIEYSKALGAIVIISTIFPVGDIPLERKLFWSDDVSQAVEQVNAYITTLETDKVIVFDAFSILADEQGRLYPEYTQDELHLNSQGYEVLNQALVQLLSSSIMDEAKANI